MNIVPCKPGEISVVLTIVILDFAEPDSPTRRERRLNQRGGSGKQMRAFATQFE